MSITSMYKRRAKTRPNGTHVTNEMSASLDSNVSLTSEPMDQSVNQFYEEFIDGTGHWFLCKYQECGELETTEMDIIEHLKQHFPKTEEIPENLIRMNLSNSFSDESPEFKTGIECIDLSIDESMIKSEPMDDFSGHTNGNINMATNGLNEFDNAWEKWFDIEADGKMRCLFTTDCRFECSLRMKAKHHINKHLEDLKNGCNLSGIQTGTIPQEHEFWDQFLADNSPIQSTSRGQSAKSTPKTPVVKRPRGRPKSTNATPNVSASKSEIRSATKTAPLTEAPESTPSHNLVDVHFNQNDALLSLKGMASVKKLDQYIRCEVVNDCKFFCCNFNNSCLFKSKRSQETALHVHCTHLNFFLRCVQPGCDRIFRTPGSWREHQKNHICNFGLYGYQRGVTGKCRNEYLKQFQEKIIMEGNQKAYRCLWKDCGFTTKHRTGVKRHIHNNHVCEYRKTKLWKTRLLELMQNNSYMTDIAIPTKQSTGYKRVHVCHRPECSAHFGTESDLKKHEATCAKLAKTGPNLRSNQRTANAIQLSVINAFNGSQMQVTDRRSSKRIEQRLGMMEQHTKTNQQPIRNVSHVSQNLNGSDTRAQCEQYIEVKPYEGVDYYLCKASNCKFVTKNAEKIYDHIQSSHSLVDGERPAMTIEVQPVNTRKSSSTSDNVNFNDNTKRLRTNSQNASQNAAQSSHSGVTQNQTKSSDSMSFIERYKDLIEVKSIDSEPHYFCKYSDKSCRFYSNSAHEIEEHIRQTHIVFRCDVKDCDREFKTQNLLDIHRRNHICGFGIRGMKASGVCSLDNVRKYRREVVMDGRYQYECKSCGYVSDSKTTVLSHIHNRHIHPQPPPDD